VEVWAFIEPPPSSATITGGCSQNLIWTYTAASDGTYTVPPAFHQDQTRARLATGFIGGTRSTNLLPDRMTVGVPTVKVATWRGASAPVYNALANSPFSLPLEAN